MIDTERESLFFSLSFLFGCSCIEWDESFNVVVFDLSRATREIFNRAQAKASWIMDAALGF